MSKHNLSRAAELYSGDAGLPGYDGGRLGIEFTPLFRWKPAGVQKLTLASGPAAGAASATLNANWAGLTGLYPLTLTSSANSAVTQTVQALLTNGATTCPFYPAQPSPTGGSYGAASAPQNPNAPEIAGIFFAATTTALVGDQPPVVGSANAYSTSQSVSASALALINGALATTVVTSVPLGTTATYGVPDVPRNVVAAWTATAVLTITGLDYWGQPQTEASGSGTSFTGKKAFSAIISATFSASVTGATIGTGNVLGLPFRIWHGDMFSPIFNDVMTPDAGTLVVADLTLPATSTTGDVRGTYAPAGTLNGAKYISALMKVRDNQSQVGSFGVTPA